MKKYYIYYDIDTPYFDGEKVCSAEDFVKFFDDDQAAEIELHINSFGGRVDQALAMLAAIERHTGRVVAYVDGVAASCASWLALAADEIHIAKNAEIFIHRASSYIYGNAEELEKEAEVLRSYDERIINLYKSKAKDLTTDFSAMMSKETTLTADEAAKVWNIIVDEPKEVATNKTRCTAVAAKCNHKPQPDTQPQDELRDLEPYEEII